MNPLNLLTVKETAAYLRIPLPTVYYLVQRKQLPAVQIGGRWRIKKDLLDHRMIRRTKAEQPTVLVVDDEPGVQSLFEIFLGKLGFRHVMATSGEEAIQALKSRKFDLCFLDLVLPDRNGDEICNEARIIMPQLPVVIITGYPDSTILDNVLKHGPVTVLRKPLKTAQITQTLELLGHRTNRKAAA